MKPLGVNAVKQVGKRITAGNTMVQLEKRPEESFLFTAKDSHVATSFTATDDGYQTDDQHVMEIMLVRGSSTPSKRSEIFCIVLPQKLLFFGRIGENAGGTTEKLQKR